MDWLQPALIRMQLYFPDKRLVQYDCGKLQCLVPLLRRLKMEGHRALIFTQMTRMLDILEIFLNLRGYTYLRLDGTTKVERRQMLMERFNKDPRIFLFILSTRSGGIGVNLTGADTVIFYDSDWNPAMDAQAQDRCHRIGQTREVHIYRLISEHTIEENILKKSNQKRQLDEMVITAGSFTTDFFKSLDLSELFGQQPQPQSAPNVYSSHEPNSTTETTESSAKRMNALEVTEQDWIRALVTFEEENDAMALKKAQAEQDAELEEFNELNTNLTPSQHRNETTMTDEKSSLDNVNEKVMKSEKNSLEQVKTFSSFTDEKDLKEEADRQDTNEQSLSLITSSLSPLQRYALEFLEFMKRSEKQITTDTNEEARDKKWESEILHRIRDAEAQKQQQEKEEQEDDMLYYAVV